MATKRMFSLNIVDTDAFLDMPASSQLLYFHLSMRADDEGFVGNPKKIGRIIGASDDDLKVLIAKRFLLAFESGVVVIKHWLMHNTIRMDRFGGTNYTEERALLSVKENKAYTLVIPDGNQLATVRIQSGNRLEPQVKLSKVKLSKDSNTTSPSGDDGFKDFWSAYPRKVGKPVAHKAYVKALTKANREAIMKGLEVWATSSDWAKDDGQFIPHASTWLNQERWNDEPRKATAAKVDRFTKETTDKPPF